MAIVMQTFYYIIILSTNGGKTYGQIRMHSLRLGL